VKLFQPVKRTLAQALQERLVRVVEVSGKQSWKGMELTLENMLAFRGVEVTIPECTTFRDTSGKYQEFMTTTATTIYLEPRMQVTHVVENATCDQPRMPVPPWLYTPPTQAIRDIAEMPPHPYLSIDTLINIAANETGMSKSEAARLKEAVSELRKNKNWRGFRQDYNYEVRSPSDLTNEELVERLLGVSVNEFLYGDRALTLKYLTDALLWAPNRTLGTDRVYRGCINKTDRLPNYTYLKTK
jgi:hypothetical protein